MDAFIVVRPWWLLTLLPLALLFLQLYRRRTARTDWDQIVDPVLAPHVLEPAATRSRPALLWLLGLAWLLAVIALAGPSWQRQELPVYHGQDALLIVLDLSRSMDAEDIKPSRLERTKFKITDLLQRSVGMQVGLLVFAEVAYVISPLTDDLATLTAFLPALSTSVVPVQGGQLGNALTRAQALLEQAGMQRANIIVITDSKADQRALSVAEKIAAAGFSLSVLGVGTEQGMPITLDDGHFMEDASGKVVLPRLDRRSLQKLANTAGGLYQDLVETEADLDALFPLHQLSGGVLEMSDDAPLAANWIEQSPWLLCIILLLALTLFRRGTL